MFTYNDTLPTDLDVIRSQIGDTDSADVLHSDEHINAVLVLQGSVVAAVSYLAYELVARYGRDPVKVSLDGETYDYSARIGAWSQLASRNAPAATGSGISQVPITYGGIARDEYSRGWR